MHEYYKIKSVLSPILEAAGYLENSENNNADCYGSISTHYQSGNEWARTGWDGIGGYGYASLLGGNGWQDLDTKVFESNDREFENAASSLSAELQRSLKQ